MKFNKLVTLLLAAGFATTALAANQGGGEIHFEGEIIDSPCSLDPESSNLKVPMGAVSNKDLAEGKIASKSEPVRIKLSGCTLDTLKTVQVKFSGTADAKNPELIGLSGTASGAGIRLTDAAGGLVKLGELSKATNLIDGINTLNFSAALQGSAAGTAVTAGDFNAVTTFALEYK